MKRTRSGAGFLAFAVSCLSGIALAAGNPTPTPTPAPRLTGGFGKPRAAPAPAAETAGGGQSRSDLVKAAPGSRRENAARKALTITNDSLVTDPSKGRLTTGIARQPTPGARPTPASPDTEEKFLDSTPQGGPAPSMQTGESEARWQETAQHARRRVADLETRVAELEAAVKRLESDFYSWDDGQYRDRVIKPAWDRTRQDLETARGELAQAQKELAELPEKARKAGVPPGWLRE